MYSLMSDLTIYDGLMVIVAYFVGGISPGYLLVRFLRGVDLRTVYSGSLGARNAGRVLGRKGFYATLIIDILKGFVIVMLARVLEFSPAVVGMATVAVVVGPANHTIDDRWPRPSDRLPGDTQISCQLGPQPDIDARHCVSSRLPGVYKRTTPGISCGNIDRTQRQHQTGRAYTGTQGIAIICRIMIH